MLLTLDFIINGNYHIWAIFFIYIWILFLLRVIFSLKYKPYTEPHFEKISVIVPVYNENFKLFDKCLKSIYNENPDEIIVVINGGGNKEKDYIKIAKKYKARIFTLPEPAKRPATALGIKEAKNDIVFLLDSDTVLTKGTLNELLKPFKDPKVGGATITQAIINSDKSIVRKFAGWMEDIRFAITEKSQGAFKSIGCLPGRAIAFRRKLLLPYLDEFVNEKFLGITCLSGDDRFLTSVVLKQGYKTVLQSTGLVYTNCPDTFLGFLKQQLRWARSSQRETFSSIHWLYKYPYTFFSYVTDIITPFFFLYAQSTVWAHWIISGINFTNVSKLIIDSITALFFMNLSIGIRQLPHLKKHPNDIFLLPLYTLFLTFIMAPLRIYGFFTMHKQEWATRNVIWSDGGVDKLLNEKN
jgi:hyaluronan synthase